MANRTILGRPPFLCLWLLWLFLLGGSVAPSLSDRPMRVLRDSKHKSSARCTLAATILWRWTLLFLATSHVLPIAQFKDSWLMLSFSPHLISLRTHESSTRGRTTEMELLPLGNAAANYPISSESNRSASATDLSQWHRAHDCVSLVTGKKRINFLHCKK